MQTFDNVARLARQLPEVTEGQEKHRGHRTWEVGGKASLGTPVQQGGPEALRGRDAAGLGRSWPSAPPTWRKRRRSVAANPDAFFTIAHFDGYKAFLIQLDEVSAKALKEALVDGWLAVAPRPLADRYLAR